MTVSILRSGPGRDGVVVVQTNCIGLDGFITELADAMEAAQGQHEQCGFEHPRQLFRAVLRNAFPIAFAIQGYKAERVHESKLLTCGEVPTDGLFPLAQSCDLAGQ